MSDDCLWLCWMKVALLRLGIFIVIWLEGACSTYDILLWGDIALFLLSIKGEFAFVLEVVNVIFGWDRLLFSMGCIGLTMFYPLFPKPRGTFLDVSYILRLLQLIALLTSSFISYFYASPDLEVFRKLMKLGFLRFFNKNRFLCCLSTISTLIYLLRLNYSWTEKSSKTAMAL